VADSPDWPHVPSAGAGTPGQAGRSGFPSRLIRSYTVRRPLEPDCGQSRGRPSSATGQIQKLAGARRERSVRRHRQGCRPAVL